MGKVIFLNFNIKTKSKLLINADKNVSLTFEPEMKIDRGTLSNHTYITKHTHTVSCLTALAYKYVFI